MRAAAMILFLGCGCAGLGATEVSDHDGEGSTLGRGAFGIWEDPTGDVLGVDIVLHDLDSPACVAGCDDTAGAAEESVTTLNISLVTPPARGSFRLETEPVPCGHMASGDPLLCPEEGSPVHHALLVVRPPGCTEPAASVRESEEGELVIEGLSGSADRPSELTGHVSFAFDGATWSGSFRVGHCDRLDYSWQP